MSILVDYINERVGSKKNKNFAMIFVGATGSGKSYAALKLAEEIDPTFTINRVFFEPTEFMKKIKELTVTKSEDNRGKVLIWDEFGVKHNAREFMSISNRVVNFFFQTSRHYNLVIIVTVPLLSFIDSATRKIMHCVAEMTNIDTERKISYARVKMIQTNVMSGKEYPKYLRFKRDGRLNVAKRMGFKLPSKELLEGYEKKKQRFTSDLYKDIIQDLDAVESKKYGKRALTEFQEKILELKNSGVGIQREMARILGATEMKVSNNIKWMKNKGYSL